MRAQGKWHGNAARSHGDGRGRSREELKSPGRQYNGGRSKAVPIVPRLAVILLYLLAACPRSNLHQVCYPKRTIQNRCLRPGSHAWFLGKKTARFPTVLPPSLSTLHDPLPLQPSRVKAPSAAHITCSTRHSPVTGVYLLRILSLLRDWACPQRQSSGLTESYVPSSQQKTGPAVRTISKFERTKQTGEEGERRFGTSRVCEPAAALEHKGPAVRERGLQERRMEGKPGKPGSLTSSVFAK